MVRMAGIPDSTPFHPGRIADKLREGGFAETFGHRVSLDSVPKIQGEMKNTSEESSCRP